MTYRDDRDPRQTLTHRLAVVATDSFLSGWGEAAGGVSYAGWAFKDGDQAKVERWVRARGEMKRVRIVILTNYRPRGIGHCYIYVVDREHPALQ